MAQCKATTAKGTQCSYSAKDDSDFCGLHMKDYDGGRPSKLDDIDYEQVEKLARLGATDKEIADFYGVTEQTVNNKKQSDKEFFESLKRGKMLADANVSDRLYNRALGYTHEAVKIFHVGKEVLEVPYMKHYPPDTTAAIYWLKNRRPKDWRDNPDTPPEKPNTEQYLKALGKVAEDVWQESKQD